MAHALDIFFSELVVVKRGGMNKEPGAVRAFFRNGKFTNIARQGQFDIPILRRTLIGYIEAMNISTSVHEVAVDVLEVPCADSHVHPKVTVRMLLRLNDAEGYRALARLLTDHGSNIGTYLGGQLAGRVDAQVRGAFSTRSSDELLREPLTRTIPIALDDLALGAVQLHDVTGIEWTRAAAYQDSLEARARASSLHDIHLVEGMQVDHEVDLERRRRNLSEEDKWADHERTMELARLESMTTIATGFFEHGRGSGKDFEKVREDLQLDGGRQTGPRWPADLPPPRHPDAIDAGGATIEQPTIPSYSDYLGRDSRLTRAWRSAGLPNVLAGCAATASGGHVGAVFVVADASAPLYGLNELRPLESELLGEFNVESVNVIVLSLVAQQRSLIENYLAQAAALVAEQRGVDAAGSFTLGLDEGFDDTSRSLVIYVSGPGAGPVRQALEDPALCVLQPLTALLPLDSVRVQLRAPS